MWVFTVASDKNLATGDLGVGQPAGGEREDLALALGEIEVRGRGGPAAGIRTGRTRLAGRGCRDDRRSGVHGADGREEELRLGVLEQEPASALPDGAGGGLVEVERREHHDARRLAGRRADSAVAARPSSTGIRMSMSTTSRMGVANDGDRLPPVGRLAHDLQVGLRFDEHADAGAEQRLVIHEHDTDHAAASPVGSAARTMNSPFCASVSSVPPTSCARSRMPITPWPGVGGALLDIPLRTSTSTRSARHESRTETGPRSPCRSALVSASCRIR